MTQNTNDHSILHSEGHAELLDAIDQLRSEGASHYVDLPQIVVCGDQSSGKSSVLEAISAVKFPKDDNLCTRFATELVLRRGEIETISVSIQPGKDATEEEKKRLSAFHAPEAQLSQFSALIEKAKVAMGIGNQDNGGQGKTFSNDVLKVELTGPKQPHLTLVDLPGLIRTETKDQRPEDILLVKNLVKHYMKNPRSIILAVVSAKSDFANQVITKLASGLDPESLRTMGILTKPDVLDAGSPSEQFFVRLAQNEEKHFRLGWHALRNRTWIERDTNDSDRNLKEKEFFRKGLWGSVPSTSLGIDSLVPRLTRVLQNQIRAQMPSLIEEVKTGIQDCKMKLEKLGMSRAKLSDQRRYLIRISQMFQMLVKAGVEGTYNHDFFGGLTNESDRSKRLRAVVQNQLMSFAEDMREKGHARLILSDDDSDEDAENPDEALSETDSISRAEYMDEVKELMKKSRGCELPGTFNPLIVGNLFLAQAKPWRELVDDYAANILDSTRQFLDQVLSRTTSDENTKLRIQEIIVGPAMDEYEKKLTEKIGEILRPHQTGHPITYNHYFTETFQKMNLKRTKDNLLHNVGKELGVSMVDSSHRLNINPISLAERLATSTEKDMETFAASSAIDCMQAYYKVALKVIIDNFATLGVEYCLLERLTGLFTPETVDDLSEETVHLIAAETDESQAERVRAENKQASLEHSLGILRNFSRYGTVKKSVIKHVDDAMGAGARNIADDEKCYTITPNTDENGKQHCGSCASFAQSRKDKERATKGNK